MKWALCAILSFLIDGLELSEQVTQEYLQPHARLADMAGSKAVPVSWGLTATENSHRSPGPIASLPQGPHTSHSKARGSRRRGDPLPVGSESSPTHSSEMCDTCLQALCRGWGRYVACQAGWMLPLKWLFLLSFDVHSNLNCIFNWHKQADVFSIGMHRFKIRCWYYKKMIYLI